MIISHKYRFIFIKTVKTAGTSIEAYLSQFCDAKDVITPIYPRLDIHKARNYKGLWNPVPELNTNPKINYLRYTKNLVLLNKYYNHIPARFVRNRVSSDVWNKYYKFCVERNPWDKSISHYSMLKQRSGNSITFDDYLRNRNFCVNFPKYLDENNNIIVDKIIRYESLDDELNTVFSNLDIPFSGTLEIKAKSEYRKDKRHYHDIYTDKQAEVIARAFEREIKLHGYQY